MVSFSVTKPQGEIRFINFSPRILSIRRTRYGISYSSLFQPVMTSGVLSSSLHQLMKLTGNFNLSSVTFLSSTSLVTTSRAENADLGLISTIWRIGIERSWIFTWKLCSDFFFSSKQKIFVETKTKTFPKKIFI